MAVAAAIVMIGAACSIAAALAIARTEAKDSQGRFGVSAAGVVSRLSQTIQNENDLVISAGGFADREPDPTSSQLAAWLATVQAPQRYPELQQVMIIQKVPVGRLADFAAGRWSHPAAALPDSTLALPPTARGYYCLASATGYPGISGSPVGVDLCANEAVARSRDSGRAVTTRITGGQWADGTLLAGTPLAVVTPIYRGGYVPGSVTSRQEAFVCWIVMTINTQVILNEAIGNHPDLGVTLRYDNGSGTPVVASGGVAVVGGQTLTTSLSTGLTVTVTGPPDAGGVLGPGSPVVVLVTGLAASLLLGVLILVLATGRERALRLVSQKTDELAHLALHDALTGMPNRALIVDRVDHALARVRRSRGTAAVLFVDLDGFKKVNDTFGHAAGDHLLCTVAARLTGAVRASDTAGRLGGDEFVVIVEDATAESGAEIVAERILSRLAEPVQLNDAAGTLVRTRASIGIAVGLRDSSEDLLRDADIALYAAKTSGKDRFVLFAPQMHEVAQARLALETDLRVAVGTDQFFLLYQPIFDLRTEEMIGVEALLRWQHPERGVIAPDQFIPLAEETGLIVGLGRWVLGEACRQAVTWQAHGHNLMMSVNVSSRQFDSDVDIVADVRTALADSGLEADRLMLEITESRLMRDAEQSAVKLGALKDCGIRLAIDDFGTGYSSLSYLQQFRVDVLKIDRSFVASAGDSTVASALLRTVVQLGKAFGIETLAEGIEEEAQLRFLQRAGCDSGQGFLFAKPMAPESLEELAIRTKATPRKTMLSLTRAPAS
ncbi:MAG TPA: EAL domain-containing protein [Pilimelia sp.]|nr:EAL domain-containing protein [Pilimelia sp.]